MVLHSPYTFPGDKGQKESQKGWNQSIDQSNNQLIYPEIVHTLHPYIDLHGDLFTASVAVDFEDLREDYDDASLGLNETAVKRNFIHNCLEGERRRN